MGTVKNGSTIIKKQIVRQARSNTKVISLFTRENEQEEPYAENDAELLEQIATHNHAAFAQLVRRHTARFYRVAYRFLLHRETAEDIVQEAFLKLWERPSMWQADRNAAFTTWFYRIIVNQCLDHIKKKRPAPLLDDSWIEDDRINQEQDLLQREKQTILEHHIGQLPERQRTALNLCFYEGLSNKQAAEIMGVRLKALQALLMRAKTTLKEKLHFTVGGD